MIVIGLVGGIASGKSLVAKHFQQLGAMVLDADRIGHGVLRLASVKRAIREHWGDGVFGPDGEVVRSALAQTVFGLDDASRKQLARLEAITHPLIAEQMRSEIDRWRQSDTVPAVILDAPVLIKAGWSRFCDKIVLVAADDQSRQHRARSRGWSADEWRRREAMQTPMDQLQRMADATIDNTSTPEAIEPQVQAVWRRWGLPVPARRNTSDPN